MTDCERLKISEIREKTKLFEWLSRKTVIVVARFGGAIGNRHVRKRAARKERSSAPTSLVTIRPAHGDYGLLWLSHSFGISLTDRKSVV